MATEITKPQRPREADLPVKNHLRGYFEWRGIPFTSVHYVDRLEAVENFQFGEGDVVIWTYPKCGTHFGGDIAADIMKEAGKPFINYAKISDLEIGELKPEVHNYSPKIMCTHLPWNLLPIQAREGKVKMVMITRNPKDVCCSFHAFLGRPVHSNMSTLEPPDTSLDTFIEIFTNKKVVYGDYFEWIKQWYPHRNENFVLNMQFEEMKMDLRAAVIKLTDFLEVSLSEEQMSRVIEKNIFENRIKEVRNHMDKAVLRKGAAGGWRDELTEQQSARLDEWITRSMKGLDEFNLKC